MNREELVALVLKITRAEGSEADIDLMIELLEQNVPHPGVSDLIFYPDRENTAEEIVDRALSYRPFSLPAGADAGLATGASWTKGETPC